MKLTTLILLITISPYSNLHAQLLQSYGLKVGVVGANQSWRFLGVPELPTNNRWGFTASAFLEFFDHSSLSVLLEVQYTQKGMSESIPLTTESQPEGTGEFRTIRPRADYISMPLLVKLRYPQSVLSPYLIAGPRVDRLLYTRGDGYDAVVDKFHTFEFGATIGIGLENTSLLPVSVLAEFRYNASFTHSFRNDYVNVTNRSIDFVVGVHL